jgi:uncharacterized Ntn-hydrolase superfamily protein
MTFSIVARDQDGHSFGVAVASKFLAVGSVVPAAQSDVGAIATQAFANLRYRPDGLAKLSQGLNASEVAAELVGPDEQREHRQFGVVDGTGLAATYTGSECFPWAGGVTGPGYSIQGNILASQQVVEAMQKSWTAADLNRSFTLRLLDSLLAGDRAGGDSRGRQSAAILVVTPGGGYGGGSDVAVDLRVDDHADPVPELGRLLGLHDLVFGRPDPAECLPLVGTVADEVRGLLGELGHRQQDLERALEAYAGIENLEERMVPGRIDPRVLEHLRSQSSR